MISNIPKSPRNHLQNWFLYQFQIICTEFIPVDFSCRLLIWNPQTGMWTHVEGLATYFLFLSITLFSSCCWSTKKAWFNMKCPHQWKENYFQYLSIRSREWQVICLLNPLLLPWLYLMSYFLTFSDPEFKCLYIQKKNICYHKGWFDLISDPDAYYFLGKILNIYCESTLALSGQPGEI